MEHKEPVLLVLIPGFPANEADSSCLPAQQTLLRRINLDNPSVKIIVLSFQYPFARREYNWLGNTVIAFGGKNRGGLSRLLLWQKIRRRCRSLFRDYTIRGILSFWCGETGLLGKQLADKYGIPHYCWIMGQDAKKENQYVQRMKPLAGELMAISDFIRAEFEKNHGIIPGQVIPLGVDREAYGIMTGSRDIDVLAAGSLIPLKRYEIFLELIALLKKQRPGIRAVLAGTGPEKEKLIAAIDKMDVRDNVELTGELPHADVIKLMQQAKVFLHTSAYEGFGMVCLEALGAGTPVISFTRPMQQEIPGWLVAASTEEMARLTADLLNRSIPHTPQYPFPVEDTARNLVRLFEF